MSALDAALSSRAGWLSPRNRRYLQRIAESPPRFLARKAYDLGARRIWARVYGLNATSGGRRVLRDLAGRGPTTALSPLLPGTPLGDLLPRPTQEKLLERADRALQHRVPCLGFGELDLGQPPRWSDDLVAGFTWPDEPAFQLDYVKSDVACDVKVAWEVNRLQFLPWLGQALRLRADARYVNAFETLLTDWWERNPPGWGVAWACPMEVAFRGINLAVALDLLSPAIEDDLASTVRRALDAHVGFLRRHPELSDVTGNHYLADLVGIVFLGLHAHAGSVPGWVRRAMAALDREILHQIHPDGCHIEHATGYQRLVAELVLTALWAEQRRGITIAPAVRERCERMIEFLASIAGDDGQIPLVGDSDSGQLTILGLHDINDVRPLLALGAVLFGRADWKERAGAPDAQTVWWLGDEERRTWDALSPHPVPPRSRRFDDGGYVVLAGEGARVVTRCGEPGLHGRAPHDHSDLTSFTAVLSGVPVVVDPGTSTYTGSLERRRQELLARAHNMLLVDRREPASIVTGSVTPVVGPDTRGRVLDWCARDTPSVRMTHDGFGDVDGLQNYERTLELRDNGTLLCTDVLEGTGEHLVEAHLHLDPRWARDDDANDTPSFVAPTGERLHLRLESGWSSTAVEPTTVSPYYGSRHDALRVRLEGTPTLPTRLAVEIRVTKPGENP